MRSEEISALAGEYWNVVLEAQPSYATFIGDRRFDDRIEDVSPEAEARLRESLRDLSKRTTAIAREQLDTADRVTRGLLLNEMQNAIAGIDARLVELQSDQMQGVHAGLLQLAPQINAPAPKNATDLTQRYRQVGTLLDQALDRFRAGLDGRPPARTNIERSIHQLDGYLASPLEVDPFVTMPGPANWDGDEAWRTELATVVEDTIRPAMTRYRDVLAEELAPAARDDEHAGLTWIEDGDELYRTLISIHTSLSLDADEIHAIGIEEITERLPEQYHQIGGRLFGTSDLGEIFDRLRGDSALRYATAREIREAAAAALAKAKAAMVDWFGILPEIDCVIDVVPEFLAADAPAAYYFPPAGDGSRPGTYFVNTHSPEDKARFESESIGFHEAIPGHHLQIAIATELPDVPDFQRFSLGNTAYVEGWALYAEHLADEMGLYEGDLQRLGMLTADSWRAGRLVVDTGLHALGWSRQKAIEFLVANTPLDPEEIAIEVDRYIGMPGQALAYKTGQREISRLRNLARDALGARFDIKGFHDAVLGSGSVTLPILAEVVQGWIAARSAQRG